MYTVIWVWGRGVGLWMQVREGHGCCRPGGLLTSERCCEGRTAAAQKPASGPGSGSQHQMSPVAVFEDIWSFWAILSYRAFNQVFTHARCESTRVVSIRKLCWSRSEVAELFLPLTLRHRSVFISIPLPPPPPLHPSLLHLFPHLSSFLYPSTLSGNCPLLSYLSIYASVDPCSYVFLALSLSQLVSHILFYLWAVRSLIKAVSQMGGNTTEPGLCWLRLKGNKGLLPDKLCGAIRWWECVVCFFLCWCDCMFFQFFPPEPVLASFCLIATLMFCIPPRPWREPNLLLFCFFVKPQTRQMAVKSLRQFSEYILGSLIKITK